MKHLLTDDDFIRIGYATGLSGYQGGLKIELEEEAEEYFYKEAEFIYFLISGMYVPHFIREKKVNKREVYFERILSREAGMHLTDQAFYFRKEHLPEEISEKLYRHPELLFLKGYEIHDQTSDRVVGRINAVDEYPSGWMAETIRPSGDSILIPLADQLISSIDEKSKILKMDLPEGLADL